MLSQRGKCIEEFRQALALRLGELSEAVKGGKGLRFAMLKEVLHARDPIRPFAMDQMTNDIEGTPGRRSFGAGNPRRWQVAKPGVEGMRRSREETHPFRQRKRGFAH